MRNRSVLILFFILVITAGVAFFIYPKWLGAEFAPWRLGLDIVGGARLVYDIDLSKVPSQDQGSLADGLRDTMERRVNSFGVSEATVTTSKSGDLFRLLVELPGIKNTEDAIKQIGRTAFLDFREVVEVPSQNGTSASLSTGTSSEVSYGFLPTELTGRYLSGAKVVTDQFSQPQVSLDFNDEGGTLFEQITERNVGKQLAIFVDNELISSPVVREKISGGSAVISGLTVPEARSLANLLNAGALQAPVNLVSQYTVGATLGGEFLKKAIIAGALGTAMIILFMLVYYRGFGIFASCALLIYIILTLGVFKLFGVTMTLAGIAGFILSIGMAVDANILIFERTKEEITKGVSRLSAIQEGFRRAWPSIRDSNVSTIITTLILFFFTTSFVKGFALTLLIGVLASMFSAITVTRTLMRVFVK